MSSKPSKLPKISAMIGPLAAIGEMGLIEIGGRTSQLRVAPHVIAAKESVAVGIVNKTLSLCKFKSEGCCDGPSWLMIVARAV